jgi:hypothetical protein
MDESNRQINSSSLKKSVTSLTAAIAIIDESDHQINFNILKKIHDLALSEDWGIVLSFSAPSKK